MRTPRVLAAGLTALAVVGCANDAPSTTASMPGEPFEYGTHCGVGQAYVDGTVYYPTAVYDGEALVTGSDPSWYPSAGGPTPWITVGDHTVSVDPDVADMSTTYGTIELNEAEGTAVFHVTGGRWTVHFTDDKEDATWVIEGCA